jgi:hypothetical protein
LAIIIEAARSNEPPIDPSIVGVPYLNHEAIDLLSNCCTSKEFDLWQSLGPNWVQPIKHNARLSTSYQPVFTDGWAPNITEPELIGIASESEQEEDQVPIHVHREEAIIRNRRDVNSREYQRGPPYDDSDIDDNHIDNRHIQHRVSPSTSSHATQVTRVVRGNTPPSPIDSIERDSPTVQVNELDQSEWVAELQTRNAKIVRVLFPRTANNDKELTVIRGEILEILDDSRKWWKARNWRGQVAHVPHTIVTEINHTTNGRERDPHIGNTSPNDDWIRRERQAQAKESQSALFADVRKIRRKSELEDDPLYSIPFKQNSNPSQQRPQEPKSHLSDQNQVNESNLQSNRVLNIQLKESIQRTSNISSDRTDYSKKRIDSYEQDDRRSVQSQISFQDELTATLKNRKTTVKSSILTSDENGFTANSKESENKSGELTLSLLVEHLHRKNFHPRMISKLTEQRNNYSDPVKFFMTASKQQLRDILPDEVADEYEVQRLHSNLVILKNLHSYAPMDDELNSKLKERRTLYDPIKN